MVCNRTKLLVMQVINVEVLIHKSELEEHIEDCMSEQSMVSMWNQIKERVRSC